MKIKSKLILCSLLFTPLISYCQSDSIKSLSKLINGEGVFFDKYNKRDQQFQKRLKKIVEREKIDTILVFLNENMYVKGVYNLKRDSREYLIYQKNGNVYIDYFSYAKRNNYDKYRKSLNNPLPKGGRIFNYFIENKLDTVKGEFNYGNILVTDEVDGLRGYINIGNEFYEIASIPGYMYSMKEAKNDKRKLFYDFIMELISEAGY